MNRYFYLLFPLFLAILGGCQSTINDPDILKRTWENGALMIPASASIDDKFCSWGIKESSRSCHSKIDRSRKHPVILFMHGCRGGIFQGEHLAKYEIVIAPNSLARPNRRVECRIGVGKRDILLLRLAEIEYAYGKLLELTWVNTEKIYLAGFSEGAWTTALYSGDEDFAGRIIIDWICTSAGSGNNTGIRGPKVPVLAVSGTDDPYHQSASQVGKHCGLYFSDRPHSRSVVIPGGPHSSFLDIEFEEALEEFLTTVNSL